MLTGADKLYLEQRQLQYEEIQEGGQTFLMLKDLTLPDGRYNPSTADVLFQMPDGYPDLGPDMFFLHPAVMLADCNMAPSRTGTGFGFFGKDWQRWSRHNSNWTASNDGIWTAIRRMERSLMVAKADQ